MLIKVRIQFQRPMLEDGFGFRCLKAAYLFRIKGRMDYCNGQDVCIQTEGDENSIHDFIEWIKSNVLDSSRLIQIESDSYTAEFREFDIYRHTSEMALK